MSNKYTDVKFSIKVIRSQRNILFKKHLNNIINGSKGFKFNSYHYFITYFSLDKHGDF
ncbi:hypothetical protein SAMN04487911_10362 [Arenibacter nanhaiticus]|uniref:Uncharacterized protein n=1 Tax=Arenibacter nanhaiticus TaxID=558155 RepID=A0A1M6C2T4_9FLAO|nr:hypothetical protein SAMN04487911_10362 [Arenibacter nanhaiticus]